MCVGVLGRVYLRPGSVIEEDGELWYVDEYVYVAVNLECIGNGPKDIKKLNSFLVEIREVLKNMTTWSHGNENLKKILDRTQGTVDRIQGRLDAAALWFPGLFDMTEIEEQTTTPAPRRRKRAVVLAAGLIAAALAFATVAGVSITSLIKVTNLEKEVEEQGQKIDKINQNVADIEVRVNDLVSGLEKVQSKLEVLSQDFNALVNIVYLQTVLRDVEHEANYIIDCVHTQAELVQEAAHGKVSVKLIPLVTLRKTLKNAAFKWGFKPLFTDKDMWNYYTVIEGLLSTTGVVAKIPMSTDYIFNLFNIYPFPSFHNDDVLKLNSNDLILIYSKRYYSCVEKRLIDSCVRVINKTICVHPRFAVKFLQPQYDCCYELVMNATSVDVCDFHKSTPTAHVLLLQNHIATFFPKSTRADFKCGSSGKTEARVLHGTSLVHGTCAMTTNSFYYPGTSIKMVKLDAPEFRSHKVATPGNLSYLAIPHGYKFKRVERLVLIKDQDAWMRHFSPSVRLGLTLGLACLMLILLAAMVGLVVYICKKKKSGSRDIVRGRIEDTVKGDEVGTEVKPDMFEMVHTSLSK